jgi:dTDP-4-amino-4,6-dideoxygalactose transaminase
MMKTPVMRPLLPTADAVLPYLRTIDRGRVYSNRGPLVIEFERQLADFLGVDAACLVTCSSATLGIEGLVRLIGPPIWRLPAFTFSATALAVKNAGKGIAWADVDPVTFSLVRPELNSRKTAPQVSESSAAPSIVVAPFGARVTSYMFQHGQVGIVDAAASLGSSIDGLPKIPDGWSVVFSLHATKPLGVGESGSTSVLMGIESLRS